MKNIRVLVVDDSAFLRRTLSAILEAEPQITVIGTAANGQEAVEKAKSLRPDVITLDVLMPIMDGITALKQIILYTNARVLMISSVTKDGAAQTIEALSLGAVDFITKPSGPISLDIHKIREELISEGYDSFRGQETCSRARGRRGPEVQTDPDGHICTELGRCGGTPPCAKPGARSERVGRNRGFHRGACGPSSCVGRTSPRPSCRPRYGPAHCRRLRRTSGG